MSSSGDRPAPVEVAAAGLGSLASSLAFSLVDPPSAGLIRWMTFATAVNRETRWSDDFLDTRRHARE
ncbi:hypothetical protein PUR61_08715 [Streptomyces sp. BE20]|uniref:hypothetical protein n=1 Tax=Streptomyces sp. BE20 TaxID=3002525 RepID=UPI002E776819|nr:hypothetical protein [Streptomyces sp. BE20]MEE1822275.1 hypothetical protein [Streptomyces sp. BE20]